MLHILSMLQAGRVERDGEIVGLAYPNNGRSCSQHACCGTSAVVGMFVKFKMAALPVNGTVEEAIKVISLVSELNEDHTFWCEACTIGYLPKQVAIGFQAKYLNKIC